MAEWKYAPPQVKLILGQGGSNPKQPDSKAERGMQQQQQKQLKQTLDTSPGAKKNLEEVIELEKQMAKKAKLDSTPILERYKSEGAGLSQINLKPFLHCKRNPSLGSSYQEQEEDLYSRCRVPSIVNKQPSLAVQICEAIKKSNPFIKQLSR